MKEFTRQEMIDFVKYYDDKHESKCHKTFEEELNEWFAQKEASKISSNAMLKVTSDSKENKKESEVSVCGACQGSGWERRWLRRCHKCDGTGEIAN